MRCYNADKEHNLVSNCFENTKTNGFTEAQFKESSLNADRNKNSSPKFY